MERIFANLYRIGGAVNHRGNAQSYLLLRKDGNLLVCHQSGPTDEEMDEIEKLGGLDSQWICHHHDTIRHGGHERLHERFGCVLHHHRKERPGVRTKSKCPSERFGSDGIQVGSDFEGHFFPTCTSGHTIYRWRARGRNFLFTSHAMNLRDNGWEFGMNDWRVDDWGPRIDAVVKLKPDYVFPGYTAPGEDTFYRLDDKKRWSLSRALRANIKKAKTFVAENR